MMTERTQKVVQRLDSLKGMLLVNKHGHPYLLKGYTLQTDPASTSGFWPFKSISPEVTFISNIEYSSKRIEFFTANAVTRLMSEINNIIDDRNRYIHLLKELSHMGYTIKRK